MQKLKEIRKLNYITCTKFVGCVISWKTACFTMYYTCNLKKLVCLIYRVRILCQGLDCRQMMKGLVDAILNINIELQNTFNNLSELVDLLNKHSLLYIDIFIIHYYTVHRNWNVVVKLLTLHFLATCNSQKKETN